jgi:hypothetical protein
VGCLAPRGHLCRGSLAPEGGAGQPPRQRSAALRKSKAPSWELASAATALPQGADRATVRWQDPPGEARWVLERSGAELAVTVRRLTGRLFPSAAYERLTVLIRARKTERQAT